MPEADDFEKRLEKLDPQERYHLTRLRDRLRVTAVSAKAVGETLPEAVLIGDADNRKLSKSMVEITERAIDLSIRKDPETLSTALFPIIGAAIRKALNKLLADSMSNMNSGLEKAFSFRRFGWRLEAWRTGVPYLEIVLRNTLRFRVEHVLLIHGKTGILLRSLSREGAKTADDDMVASMLTAVRDYIKDSLSLSKTEAVDGISAGEFTLMAEEGPRASLALVVRGVSDGTPRTAMQDALESIHLRLGTELEAFSGDTGPFERADEYLRPCLVSRDREDAKPKPVYAVAAVCLLAAAGLFFGIRGAVAAAADRQFLAALSREPGMMVAAADRRFGRTAVKLLRDPRARPVEAVAGEGGAALDRFDFEVEEFVSPAFGSGPSAARTVPEELLALSRRLAAYTLMFDQDSGSLRAGQESLVREAGALIAELVEKAKKAGFEASVEITGHSAGTVQDDAGIAVSEERAAKAMSLFAEINAPLVKYVRTRGVGVSEPVVAAEATEEDRVKNRSVTFKTIFR
jgi:outer membrane protein OmpA-like peptidoglycan-associated protein